MSQYTNHHTICAMLADVTSAVIYLSEHATEDEPNLAEVLQGAVYRLSCLEYARRHSSGIPAEFIDAVHELTVECLKVNAPSVVLIRNRAKEVIDFLPALYGGVLREIRQLEF